MSGIWRTVPSGTLIIANDIVRHERFLQAAYENAIKNRNIFGQPLLSY